MFEFSTNSLSISITFIKPSVPDGQKALAGLVLNHSWTVTIQKNSDCDQWFFFFKKMIFLMLIIELNISNQKS